MRKGIVLAGGTGTRLHPITLAISKQLLPVFDKPMIYYPISNLMEADIREIMIISTPHDLPLFKRLLGDGSQLGMSFSYQEQLKPEGIAQAFIIGKSFIGDSSSALILGDNIFLDFSDCELSSIKDDGATIFGCKVRDPRRFGVIEFNENGEPSSIEEKPKKTKSNWAIPGIYFYDNTVIEIAKSLKPSDRGELEITDINKFYLEKGNLRIKKIYSEHFSWFDAGTEESYNDAITFIKEGSATNRKIACLEEIALKRGWIGLEQFNLNIDRCKNSEYGNYLKGILERQGR